MIVIELMKLIRKMGDIMVKLIIEDCEDMETEGIFNKNKNANTNNSNTKDEVSIDINQLSDDELFELRDMFMYTLKDMNIVKRINDRLSFLGAY